MAGYTKAIADLSALGASIGRRDVLVSVLAGGLVSVLPSAPGRTTPDPLSSAPSCRSLALAPLSARSSSAG